MRIQAAAGAFGLFAAVLLLGAVLALQSVRDWARRDDVVYRIAGALGLLTGVVALYSAADALNSILVEHGVPIFDRIESAAAGVSAALVGAVVAWLVFRHRRPQTQPPHDAP